MGFDIFPFFVFFPLTVLAALAIAPKALPRPKVLGFALLGLAIRIPLIVYLAHNLSFDDERAYSFFGESIAAALTHQSPNAWEENSFANLTGIFYYLLGASEYTVRVFNSSISVLTAFLLCHIAMLLYPEKTLHDRVLRWSMFAPPILFISCLGLKEQLVATLVVMMVHGFSIGRLRGFSYLLISTALLYIYRQDLALLLIPVTLFFITVKVFGATRSTQLRALTAVVCAIGIVGAMVIRGYDSEQLEDSKMLAILKGADTRGEEELLGSGATYARFLDASSPGSALNLLIPPIHSLFSPSPFQLLTTRDKNVIILTLFITVFTYWCTPYLLIALGRLSLKLPDSYVLAVYGVIFLSAAYSILTSAPEPFRYRWPGIPLLIFIAAVGRYLPWRFRAHVVRGWWFAAAVFGYVYLSAYKG